jgi:hypothetical protein
MVGCASQWLTACAPQNGVKKEMALPQNNRTTKGNVNFY